MQNIRIIEPTKQLPQLENPAFIAPKRRVAGYARVSTDKDEQFASYESQVEYYTRFITNRNDWKFVKVYTDEGVSGTSVKKRAGFMKMVSDAMSGKIDLIVTKSISRFARNTVDSLTAIRRLKERGVEVFFEKENIWTFDGKGELLITIMSSLAQEESRSISENVTWGMRESMRKGNAWVPYKVFLGYEKGSDGRMIIQPEQASLVRRIYGMYLDGWSTYEIARQFEAEGIPFSEGHARWYGTTVFSILTNEKYRGDALRQKTYSKDYLTKERAKNDGVLRQFYISNHHEAIIGPELFGMVQSEIEKRNMTGKRKTRKDAFRERIKCGDCGRWYSPVVWAQNTAHEKTVLRCSRKYASGKRNCIPPAVTEEKIKEVFVSAMRVLFACPEKRARLVTFVSEKAFDDAGLRAELRDNLREAGSVAEQLGPDDRILTQDERERLKKRASLAELRQEVLQRQILEREEKKRSFLTYLESVLSASSSGETFRFDERLWDALVDNVCVYSHESFLVTFSDGTEIRV